MIMFNILKKFQTKNLRRHFAHYCDTGEYHFIDKLNYVGNHGIYWTHPQSSYITRVTDDYDQCVQGNHSNDNTCWLYFPKKLRVLMENDFREQDCRTVESEMLNWILVQNAPKKHIDWYAALARCFSWFPQASVEQRIFASKQLASTFYIDDVLEKLSSERQFNSAVDELLNNLSLVFSQQSDQITDMRKFKGQNIPDRYIEKSIEAIAIQVEIVQLAKKILKPKIFDYFLLGCCHYLGGVIAEKALFQKHCPTKTIISEQEGKVARQRSIGFIWILPTMMTDEATCIHLNIQNPVVDLAAWMSILENDIVGHFKDIYVDFSPMTLIDTNSSGQSDLAAARIIAHRVNEMKKVFEYVWLNVPAENAKHYEYLARYVGVTTDYCFVLGLRNANSRYGWIPQLEDTQKILHFGV